MAWRPTPPPADFAAWKPTVCEHPDCGQPHPSFSHHGRDGPWLCKVHYEEAMSIPAPSQEVEKIDTPIQPGLL